MSFSADCFRLFFFNPVNGLFETGFFGFAADFCLGLSSHSILQFTSSSSDSPFESIGND
ncbi:MAG: hypothetical protein SF097_01200 [Acidobacteriota bacterium]|nr:hypothetical protein [Acidobacteriota bacterium]